MACIQSIQSTEAAPKAAPEVKIWLNKANLIAKANQITLIAVWEMKSECIMKFGLISGLGERKDGCWSE